MKTKTKMSMKLELMKEIVTRLVSGYEFHSNIFPR